MEREQYHLMAENEETHWWYVARRNILRNTLTRLQMSATQNVLEVGCGTGGNLQLLSEFGNLHACEMNETALKIARNRGIIIPERGCLPDALPFPDKKFDLICLFDVLEHVPDDKESLHVLRSRVSDDGYLVLTVPAYMWLWSYHDVSHHHKRRYLLRSLVSLLSDTGFDVVNASYFNTFLFPIIAGMRLLKRAFHLPDGDDEKIPAKLTNALLAKIFESERMLVPRFRLPFGVSILVVAKPRRLAPGGVGRVQPNRLPKNYFGYGFAQQ